MSKPQPKKTNPILYVLVGVLSAVVIAQSAYIVYFQLSMKSALSSALNAPIIAGLDDLQNDVPKGIRSAAPPDANQGSAGTATPFGLKLNNPDQLAKELAGFIRQFGAAYGEAFKILQDNPIVATLPHPSVVHPAFHLVEDQSGYKIDLSMIVQNKDDIHVSLTGRMLSVTAPIPKSDGQYERRIRFSSPVDPSSLCTQYLGGVLTIHIRKAKESDKIPARLPI